MSLISNLKSNIKKYIRKLFNVTKRIKKDHRVFEECIKILPKVTCIDIGASYYPHPSWEIFRCSPQTEWIACDPCQDNLNYLQNWRWPCSISMIPMGFSREGGQKTLYITAVDSGSSLLPPDIPEWKKHRVDMEYFFPTQEKIINTLTLTDLIHKQKAENNPLLIKLDTQGTELSILQGLDLNVLQQNLIAVEIEVTLQNMPVMKGGAAFYEVQKFFEDNGFELAYFKPIEGILPKFNPHLQGRSILNECDAVFMMRPDIAAQKGSKHQLVLLGVYIAYQLYGEALHITKQLLEQNNISNEVKLSLNKLYVQLQ